MSIRDAEMEDAERRRNFIIMQQKLLAKSCEHSENDGTSYKGDSISPEIKPASPYPQQGFMKPERTKTTSNYNNNRLPREDEMVLAEYFFKSGFDNRYVDSVKGALEYERGIILDTADIFGIALSNVMATPACILEDYPIITGRLDGKPNKDFERKVESLYSYLIREKSDEKITADGEKLYVAALNAIKTNGFSATKQHIVDDVFSQLKEQKIINRTFKEMVRSKRKPTSMQDMSNPAVFVYNAVINNGFEKEFIENALGWYRFCLGESFASGFDGANIENMYVVLPVNLALDAMCDSAGESFEYIKYISRVKSAKNFLKTAGFGYAAYLVHEVNANVAIKIIKQQVGRYENGAIETVLDAIEYMHNEGCELSANEVKWILEKYMSQDHPLQMARKNQGIKRRHFNSEDSTAQMLAAHGYPFSRRRRFKEPIETPEDEFNNRIRWLYRDFGGDPEFGLSAAEKYKLEKKRSERSPRQPSSGAELFADDFFKKQRERAEEKEREWRERREKEKNGFKGKEVIFEVNGIKNKSKGVVSGSALNLKLPHNIIAKVPSANKGDCFKARIVKKDGKHYTITDIQKYEGPLDFKESAGSRENSFD